MAGPSDEQSRSRFSASTVSRDRHVGDLSGRVKWGSKRGPRGDALSPASLAPSLQSPILISARSVTDDMFLVRLSSRRPQSKKTKRAIMRTQPGHAHGELLQWPERSLFLRTARLCSRSLARYFRPRRSRAAAASRATSGSALFAASRRTCTACSMSPAEARVEARSSCTRVKSGRSRRASR